MSRRLVALAGSVLFLLPLISLAHEAELPTSTLVLLGTLGGLTFIRPAWGLAAMAGFYPLAIPLSALLATPMLDARMMLTFLAAASSRLAFGTRPMAAQLGRPLLLFAVLFAASGLLQLSFQQQRTEPIVPFVLHLWQHVTRSYFAAGGAFGPLHDLAPWIEAFALAVVAERILRQQPQYGGVIARLLIIAGCAAAVFASVRLAEIALRSEMPAAAITHVFRRVRFNTLYTDVNAAGSFFALFLVAAAWMAWRGHHLWAGIGAVLLAIATWVAGSRAAFGGVVGGFSLTWLVVRRPSKRLVLAAGALAILVLLGLTMASARNLTTGRAANFRVEMAATALRLTAEAPVFGIGMNRFRPMSTGGFSQRMLATPWARTGENAHNNFLQLLAELGVFGLAAFIWSLIPVFRNAWRQTRARTDTPEMMALAGGLAAFLLSALLGHPLLIEHVRGVFFLTLGVATAISAPAVVTPSRRRTLTFALVLLVVLACVPFRLADQRRSNTLKGVFYGASAEYEALDGVPYRIAEPASVWFVSSAAEAIQIPLRITTASTPPCRIDVSIDGRPADVATPTADHWTHLSFQLPEVQAGMRSRRVELHAVGDRCSLMVGKLTERP